MNSSTNGYPPVLITVDPTKTFSTYNYNIVLAAPIHKGIANSPRWSLEKGPYLAQLVNQLGINTLDLAFPAILRIRRTGSLRI